MQQEGLFGLHGIAGMLIATALLLLILVFLGANAISVQQDNATNFYKLENPSDIKMISKENINHLKDAN